MDCSLTGSSVHGIFQARILEWVAISFSRRSSRARDWSRVSRIIGRCFTVWATREVQVSSPKIYPLLPLVSCSFAPSLGVLDISWWFDFQKVAARANGRIVLKSKAVWVTHPPGFSARQESVSQWVSESSRVAAAWAESPVPCPQITAQIMHSHQEGRFDWERRPRQVEEAA